MAERKADKLAGKGSFLAALRARRMAVEAGDPSAARDAYLEELQIQENAEKRRKRTGG